MELQRQSFLQQLSGLRQLRRGSLTDQFLWVKRKDGSRVKRGPYPLLTRKEGQKTVSLRRLQSRIASPRLAASK